MVYRARFLTAYACLLLFAGSLAAAALWHARAGRTAEAAAGCPRSAPAGSAPSAAWRAAELFVREVVAGTNPVCGYELASERLRGGVSRNEWAEGRTPFRRFATRYPAVPFSSARPDSATSQAVYVVSRLGGSLDAMAVGLAAPDAGTAAYRLALRLEGGSWRIDSCRRVELA